MTEVCNTNLADLQFLDRKDPKGTPIVTVPVKPDSRTLRPTKEDLTVSEPVTPEKIEEKLKIYGGCFVKNYLPTETCDEILSDMRPYLDKFSSVHDADNFIAPTTRRASGACIKSKTVAEKFLAHPLNIAVSNRFLGKKNMFRMGADQIVTGFSPAQHNSCIAFEIGPGSENQPLHRDDNLHHNLRHHMDEYRFGTETAVGTVLALKKTTKANGATRFIPGSHMWDQYRKPSEEETVYAEMEKGDCFFMLASCYHGGSANFTKNETRVVLILFMTQGTLRQEENIFLGTPLEYFKSLSIPALKALGLQTSQPFCGWFESDDPIKKLLPEIKDYTFDQFAEIYTIED